MKMSTYSEYRILLRDSNTHDQLNTNCKVYKRRWFILFLFALYCIANNSQWMMYVVIANVLVRFYQISYMSVLWTSMIFIVSYVVFTIPGSYLIDRLGIRNCVILGLSGTCLGTWIKAACVNSSSFWVLMLGQGVISIFFVFVSSLPTKIAAVWFSADEVSRASTIAVIGSQLGVGLGCMFTSFIINVSDIDTIRMSLQKLALLEASYSTFLLPIVILYEPPTPPSRARIYTLRQNVSNRKESLQRIFSNPSFLLFTLGTSINLAMEYPLTLLLNKFILQYHPSAGEDVGFIVGISNMIGLAVSVVFGYVLDKYHHYKTTVLISSIMRILSLTLLMSTLDLSIPIIYFIAILERISFSGLFATGLQSVVELTYPESESITCGISYASFLIIGLIFTYLYSYLLSISGQFVANIVMLCLLILSAILLAATRFDLRRQKIENTGTLEND